jgi:hypothetical protein
MLLLKSVLLCCVAPALVLVATFFIAVKWSSLRLKREKAAAMRVAAQYLRDAEPLTHDDLEMAVSDRVRSTHLNRQYAHAKVVRSNRRGTLWDTYIAFADSHGAHHVVRLLGDGLNLADAQMHQLGRSYIVAYDLERPHETVAINFVAPPASCSTFRGTP